MSKQNEKSGTETLDLRGLLCPEPVIATKKLLDKIDTKTVEALVDDDICVSNLQRLAHSVKASIKVQEKEGFFAVTISKSNSHKDDHELKIDKSKEAKQLNVNSPDNRRTGTLVFLTKDQLGEGDPDFSKTLLNVYLQSLFEGGHEIRAILLANSAVKLLAKDSDSLKVLSDFRARGTEVLACGLCVDFYGLKADIESEHITNMFAICEFICASEKLIQF